MQILFMVAHKFEVPIFTHQNTITAHKMWKFLKKGDINIVYSRSNTNYINKSYVKKVYYGSCIKCIAH